jgi:hypothetical protein
MRCAADRVGLAIAVALSIAACKEDATQGDATSDTGGDDTGGDDTGADASGSAGDDTGDVPIDAGPWASLEARPCPEDSFLSFENFGAIHLLNYCTGCHSSGLPADQRQGAPIEINFDDLEDVRGHAPRIWARAADHNVTMPPAGGAPEGERALLGEWLACGAPSDADATTD